jgi:hypothetical protein
MILGIVGPEQSAWTQVGSLFARQAIRDLLLTGLYAGVTSGACHKGGVDIWAREEAELLGLPVKEYPPKDHGWQWYKQRNQLIAKLADHVVCIAPSREHQQCRYCETDDHQQSGGCWTLRYARQIGKRTDLVVIYVY